MNQEFLLWRIESRWFLWGRRACCCLYFTTFRTVRCGDNSQSQLSVSQILQFVGGRPREIFLLGNHFQGPEMPQYESYV